MAQARGEGAIHPTSYSTTNPTTMNPSRLALLNAAALLALGACLYAGAPSIPKPGVPSRPSPPTNRVELESTRASQSATNAPGAAPTLASSFQAGFTEGARVATVLARKNPDPSPDLIAYMAWEAWATAQLAKQQKASGR